jgi:hypothetical protein
MIDEIDDIYVENRLNFYVVAHHTMEATGKFENNIAVRKELFTCHIWNMREVLVGRI